MLNLCVKALRRLTRKEEGATMVEYALLVCLIALVAAAGAFALGGDLSTLFTNIGTEVKGTTIPNVP